VIEIADGIVYDLVYEMEGVVFCHIYSPAFGVTRQRKLHDLFSCTGAETNFFRSTVYKLTKYRQNVDKLSALTDCKIAHSDQCI